MIKKFKNALGYLLVFAIFLGSFINNPINISDAADNKAWDGKKIDVTWFNPDTYDETEIYEIDSPEKLMGLAALVNGIHNDDIEVIGGKSEAEKIKVEKKEDVLLIPFDETYGDIFFGAYDFENKTVKITADLDMGGQYDTKTQTWKETSPNYMPIGGNYAMKSLDPKNTLIKSRFNGIFDGQGHSIKNVYINRYTPMHFGYSQGVGLIGAIGQKESGEKMPEQVVVKNIILESGYIYGRRMVGGIVGAANHTAQGAIIENCINKATVKSTDKKGVGGIVGSLADPNGEIRNAYNTGKIINTGEFSAGGIVGEIEGKVYKVINTGEIESKTSAEIGVIRNVDTVKGDYYYWLDNGKNGFGLKEYNSEAAMDYAENYGKKTKKELSSKEFLEVLNKDNESFYIDETGNFKLLMEKKDKTKYKVNIKENNKDFGKLVVNPKEEGIFGNSVSIREETNPGYKLEKLFLNNKEINRSSFILTKDSEISAEYSKLKSSKIIIPESEDYKLTVTKTGIANIENKLQYVDEYPVLNGDTIYEDDRIYIDINKRVESINLDIKVINADNSKYDYVKKRSFYRVHGDKNLSIEIAPFNKPKTWTDYADTSWYDSNSSSKTFKIQNHKQLAGLAKICNSTEKLYKNENFAGKTIEITTDIRLRAEDNRENKTNYIWEPIKGFKGEFNGNNHMISNVIIKGMPAYRNYQYSGFFGDLIGDDKNKPIVKNVTINGEIDNASGISSGYIGGIVAYAENAKIENCISQVSIENQIYEDINIGGAIGTINNTEVQGIKNYGEISSIKTIAGGIVGKAEGEKPIKESINYGMVYQGSLENLGGDNNSKTGGIVGETEVPILSCGNKGTVTGYNIVGGIAAESSSLVKDSYFNGGINFIDTPNSSSYIGTIIGLSTNNRNILENTYSSGSINLNEIFSENIGLVGKNKFKGKFINSYYLENTLSEDLKIQEIDEISKVNLDKLKSEEFLEKIGNEFTKDKFNFNKTYPILKFENKEFENLDIEKVKSEAMIELSKYPYKKAYTEENWKKISDILVDFNNTVIHKNEIKDIRDLLLEYKETIDKVEKIYNYGNTEEGRREKYINDIKEAKLILEEKISNPKIPNTENKEKAKKLLIKSDEYINNENIISNELGKLLKEIYNVSNLLVEDNKKPEFKKINDLVIDPIEKFDLKEGVLIIDEYFGAPEPTFEIEEESLKKFDSSKPGEYEIIYIGKDSVGNETRYTRKITVKNKINYDLNGDGKVNFRDIYELELYIANKFKTSVEKEITKDKYDLNRDGKVNFRDIYELELYIANKFKTSVN